VKERNRDLGETRKERLRRCTEKANKGASLPLSISTSSFSSPCYNKTAGEQKQQQKK